MKFVLLNGPPRSGKTTAAKMLQTILGEDRCDVIGYSYHLKRMVHAIYGLPPDTDPDAFDAVKDTSNPIFFGMSPRQAYIMWSEKAAKVFHGDDFFGKMLLRAAEATGKEFFMVPDSGFRKEAEVLIDAVDPKNILLVHLRRHGCTFEGDSRNFIKLKDLGVLEWEVWNTNEHPQHMIAGIKDGMGWAFGREIFDA